MMEEINKTLQNIIGKLSLNVCCSSFLAFTVVVSAASFLVFEYYKKRKVFLKNKKSENVFVSFFTSFFLRKGKKQDRKKSDQNLSLSVNQVASSSFFVLVYYGSQTGTAESFSEELAKHLESEYGLEAYAVDLEDFDEKEFYKANFVVFIVATYGEGDPTDNAVSFYSWLTSDIHKDNCMKTVRYAIMGLGNRQYTNFNKMAKQTDLFLQMLGAENVCVRGEADDEGDTEKDFCEWKKTFLDVFEKKILQIKNEKEFEEKERQSEIKESAKTEFDLKESEKLEEQNDAVSLKEKIFEHLKRVQLDMITSNEEFPDESDKQERVFGIDLYSKLYFQSVVARIDKCFELRQKPDYVNGNSTFHIELDVSESVGENFYKTADNIDVFPRNPSHIVKWFAERLNLSRKNLHLNSYIKFVKKKHFEEKSQAHNIHQNNHPFPTPCTIAEALECYCDLISVPPKSILRDMSCFLTDEKEINNFNILLSDENTHNFKLHIRDSRMTLVDFMEIFMKSAEIDLSVFLQLIQRQRPRMYTVSSSALNTPHKISIAVSKVHFELPPLYSSLLEIKKFVDIDISSFEKFKNEKRIYFGFCSSFLCDTNLKERVKTLRILVRHSSFRLPIAPNVPFIMVAAGTGIAPFRAFLQEMKCLQEKEKDSSLTERDNVLFFGCTHPEIDFIYKNDLLEFSDKSCNSNKNNPVLKHFILAFSRLQEKKVYVQHKILQEKELVWKLIEQGAYIYICGGMMMGRSVVSAIEEIALEYTKTENFIEKLRESHRIIEEVWT